MVLKKIFLLGIILCLCNNIFSQDNSYKNTASILHGIPPEINLPKNIELISSRLSFIKIEVDSQKSVYLLIEKKSNNENSFWFLSNSDQGNTSVELLEPNRNLANKFYFELNVVRNKKNHELEIELDLAEKICKYNVNQEIPTESWIKYSGNMNFEILYSYYNFYNTQPFRSEETFDNKFDGLCLSYSGKFKLDDISKLEIKPGIILFPSHLIGLDFGFYYRRKVEDIFFISAGIDFHFTARWATGGHSGGATREGWFAFPTITIGIPIIKVLPLLISYQYANITNYYNFYGRPSRVQYDLKSIIRIGFEFGRWE